MRVLHVISTMDPRSGGTTSALVGLATAQAKAGIHVTILSTYAKGFDASIADQLIGQGMRIQLVGPGISPLLWHAQLSGMCRSLVTESDVIHIHALWEEIQYRAAAWAGRLGKPYLFSPHGMLAPWSLSQRKTKKSLYMALRLRRVLNKARTIHFTAAQEYELTRRLDLAPPPLVEPNGIDLQEYAHLPEPDTFRRRHPLTLGKTLVVLLSRLHPVKGLDLLIPAFRICDDPAAVLVIAGPQERGYGEVVRRMIADNGLEDRVIMTGPLYGQDKHALLHDADLFCLPSYQENFGISIVEALAAGTPVIISDQVNIYREILEGEVGAVVPMQVAALAHELKRWLGDSTLRDAAAARSAEFVRRRYDWNAIAQHWKGHYARIATP